MTTPSQLPSAEALALSAAAFSASIDAWIPAGWGASSSSSKTTELTLSGFGGADDRLGLGHPLLDQPSKRPTTSGLGVLGKSLAKRPKRDDEPAPSASAPLDEDDSETEESRAQAFKSKSTGRGRGMEMLSQRKKKLKGANGAEHPAVVLSKAATPTERSERPDEERGSEATTAADVEPSINGPSEPAKKGNVVETEADLASDERRGGDGDGDDGDEEEERPLDRPDDQAMDTKDQNAGTLSKTQQRRLKRKAAKLAKKARDEASKRK